MKAVIAILFALAFFPISSISAEENFPFIAKVNAENVEVKAGGNINFENICKLSKGEEITTLEKKYNWYKIKLPKNAACYISANYIKKMDDAIGIVTGNRVNLRARANQNSSILAQLNKKDRVRIIDKMNGWYKISTPKNCFGWVQEKSLKFYCDSIEEKSQSAANAIKEQ